MPLLPWNATQTVNTVTTSNQRDPKITKLADGSMVVAWEDFSSGSFDIKFQRFDAAGNKLGAETMAHGSSAVNQTQCGVTALSGGGFVISWVDGNSAVFAQKFTANGTAIGGAIFLSTPTFTSSIDDDVFEPPVIQGLPGDQFAVFYTTVNFATASSGIDLVGRLVDATGVPGFAFNVAAQVVDTQTNAQVTLDNFGNIVLAWADRGSGSGDIKVARFNPSGVAVGAEVTVTTDATGFQSLPSITCLSNGNFIVTWYTFNTPGFEQRDIHGQIVTPPGSKIGAEFVAGTTQAGEQFASRVVALEDGKFMVVYETGFVNFPLRAQVFNSNGTPMGGELLLTSTGGSNFCVPGVVKLDDGRVAVVWTDAALDGDNNGIAVRILDPRDGYYVGTANADKIWGHDGNLDYIVGNAGADTIYGLRGNDTIFGDAGNDQLYDGRGDDTVYGGADNDVIYGDFGDDQLFGEAGNDIIYSGAGGDVMDGGAGTGDAAFYVNELLGAVVNLTDQLLTGGSALGDTLFNFERVYGSVRGANNLTGDANANILVGGLVNDTLNGGGGADVLRGWGGVDTMAGGLNNDIFQYTGNTEGGDIITDFAAGDKFQFVRTAFGNLAGANVAAVNFLSVASGHAATNASQRFIFDQATKQLWYDANGNVAGGDVMIADLSTSYNILNTDLLLA